jgi:drug/metabolite transporter (DMT)-like permease
MDEQAQKEIFMKHYLYAIGAILCWASLPAATGSGLTNLSTEELMFFSFTSAAIFLYLQGVFLKRTFTVYIPGPKGSLLGIWGIFTYHYVYYMALSHAPLVEGAILATTWSFWVVVFSSVVLFKRLKLSIIFTALLGMFGAGLVIASGQKIGLTPEYTLGYILALFCGLIWASFSLALSRINLKGEPMTAFTIFAAILSALLYLASMPHSMPSLQSLLAAIYLGCVPLGLSFFLWNRAVRGGNMVIIGFLSYFTPPLAVLLVAIIHGKTVSAQVLLGMLIIIVAAMGGRLSLADKSDLTKSH